MSLGTGLAGWKPGNKDTGDQDVARMYRMHQKCMAGSVKVYKKFTPACQQQDVASTPTLPNSCV